VTPRDTPTTRSGTLAVNDRASPDNFARPSDLREGATSLSRGRSDRRRLRRCERCSYRHRAWSVVSRRRDISASMACRAFVAPRISAGCPGGE
jgi:hypothetical protein